MIMDSKETKQNRKMEETLERWYRQDVEIDSTYKKNLDKLVENTITAKKLGQMPHQTNVYRKKSFFTMLLSSMKWQGAFLASFLFVCMFGGIVFAAVPQFREIIHPTQANINITSVPSGAEVFFKDNGDLDFLSVGTTPFSKKVTAKNYEVKLVLKGYKDHTETITPKVGENVNLEIVLKKDIPAIDKIKEWKTYIDLEQGFEFTYPLSWDFREKTAQEGDTFAPIEVVGQNSTFGIYSSASNLSFYNELLEQEINGQKYNLISDTDGWKYIIVKPIESADGSNNILTVFYTNEEQEIEIYDFIASNTHVYDKTTPDNSVENWNTFKDTDLGFSFRYPTDWLVIQRSKDEYFAEYQVRPPQDTYEPLKIIYSFGYLDLLKDYNFYETTVFNGVEVKKYCSGSCDGKCLYEFPNRLYVLYQATDTIDVNKQFELIAENFVITNQSQIQEISDYNWNFSIELPKSWDYEFSYGDSLLGDVSFARAYNGNSEVVLYTWDQVAEKWNNLLSDYKNNSEIRVSNVTIAGVEYTKNEIWTYQSDVYQLTALYFTKDQNNEGLVQIGGQQFLILLKSDISTSRIESLAQSSNETLTLLDTIVTSIEEINVP